MKFDIAIIVTNITTISILEIYIKWLYFRKLAKELWESANLDFPSSLCKELIEDVEHPVECIEIAASEALAALLENNKSEVKSILNNLIQLYKERLVVSFFLIW